MADYTKSLEYLFENTEPEINQVMKDYYNFLLELNGRRKSKRANSTDYGNLTLIRKFLRFIKYDYNQLNKKTFDSFLEEYNAKRMAYGKIKLFLRFLFEKEELNSESLTKLSGYTYSNEETNKDKKFAIPKDRWPECYNQLSGVKKFACWLMFSTGIRVSELITLEIEDFIINHKTKEYYINIIPKEHLKYQGFKTKNSQRKVYLTENLVKTIEEYLAFRETLPFEHKFILYITKTGNNCNRGDEIKNERTIRSWFSKIILLDNTIQMKECNVRITRSKKNEYCMDSRPHKHILPHNCRRSYLTFVYYANKKKGIDALEEVSNLAGHKSSNTTWNYLLLGEKEKEENTKKTINEIGL